MRLSLDEKVFIIENHKVFGNYATLRRKFCAHFKKRKAPKPDTVKSIIEKFKKLGTVENQPSSGRKRSVTTDEKIDEISDLLKNNLGMSIRRVSKAANVSVFTAHTVATKILNLYPYKIKILHELKPQDYGKRISFAEWFLSIEGIEKSFVATDEAYFHLNGAVNNHNCRIWNDTNPNIAIQQPLRPEKILVWCAVTNKKVIGPYFFETTVKHDNYLEMLKSFFWPRFYRTKNSNSFYFQQDGAPAHRHEDVQQWLSSKFGDRFLDKAKWPARSPDLNPCDYFLWGYLKDKIYPKMPNSIEDLKSLIEKEIKAIKPVMLEKVFENLNERCELILKNKGKHIE